MAYPIKKTDRKYTYQDYLNWPDDEQWELIDGVAYNMSPAPSRIHQKVVRELLRQFANYLLDKNCEVYCAPFDVRLSVKPEQKDRKQYALSQLLPENEDKDRNIRQNYSEFNDKSSGKEEKEDYTGHNDENTDRNIDTVVQPDLVVVCDKWKLDEKGCKGSPTIIIEVISPHTASKDLKIKFHLYEMTGVKEYWIIHPDNKTIMVFKSDQTGEYGKPEIYADKDSIKVSILGDLVIELETVFE